MARVNTPSSLDDEKEGDVEVLSRQLKTKYSFQTSSSSSVLEKPSIDEDVLNDEWSGRSKKGPPDMEQIALKALHVDDDATLNPWTFRVFFIGSRTLRLIKAKKTVVLTQICT